MSFEQPSLKESYEDRFGLIAADFGRTIAMLDELQGSLDDLPPDAESALAALEAKLHQYDTTN